MNKEVEDYINEQPSPQKEICLKLREIIIDTFPKVVEEKKWGVPTYGVEKDGKVYTKYYIGSLRDKVNLGFVIKGLKDGDVKRFEGTGKTMRHIKVFSPDDIDEKRIVELLKLIPD